MIRRCRNLAITAIMSVLMVAMASGISILLPVFLNREMKRTPASQGVNTGAPLIATTPGSSDPTGDEWPMFRGQLNHTGVATTTLVEGKEPTWNFTMDGVVSSSPAVTGGRVYVGSIDHQVYCLNATTGVKLWNYTTGSSVYSSPAIAGERVYMGSVDKKVYCLNATTGAKLWNYTTGNFVYSSPVVSSGCLYVGSVDKKVYCLNATTGAKLWNYTTGAEVDSSPAVLGGRVYVGSYDGKVYCFNATTGAKLWNYTTGAAVDSSPAVLGGRVYVGSNDMKVYCLNATTGAKLWNYTTGYGLRGVYSSPAIAGGRVYVGSDDKKVYCLNATTGAHVWNFTTGNSVYDMYGVHSSPAIAGGRVYVGSYDNKTYCLNATTGAKIWSYIMGNQVESSPAIAGGHVYVGCYDGKVYCLPMNFISPLSQNSITHPSDLSYSRSVFGSSCEGTCLAWETSLHWTITTRVTGITNYTIFRNGTSVGTGSWTSGMAIWENVGQLPVGVYNFTIVATDGLGGSVQDTAIITVETNLSGTDILIIIGIVFIVLLIVAGLASLFSKKEERYEYSPADYQYYGPEYESQQQVESEQHQQSEGTYQQAAELGRNQQAEAEPQRRLELEQDQRAEAERQRKLELEQDQQAEAERQRQACNACIKQGQDLASANDWEGAINAFSQAQGIARSSSLAEEETLSNEAMKNAKESWAADLDARLKDAASLIEQGDYETTLESLDTIKDDATRGGFKAKVASVEERIATTSMYKQLARMIKVAKRLKIDDVCQVLKRPRSELFDRFIEWSEKFGLMIDGDYLVVGENANLEGVMADLDKVFAEWNAKEKSKQGKLE